MLVLALAVGVSACQRGCARSWLEERGVGEPGAVPRGGGAIQAIDCPDGLARCEDGVVEVSRLATIPTPCVGRPEGCACPWERAGDCPGACVVSGATLVVDRDKAVAQLCAPAPESLLPPAGAGGPPGNPSATVGSGGPREGGGSPGGSAAELVTPASGAAGCDDDVRYRCSAGNVISCDDRSVIAHCVRGCATEGADIGDEVNVGREGAFAILCSR